MSARQRRILIVSMAIMVAVGLPMADAHHHADPPVSVDTGFGHDPAHSDHSVPAADGEHVHFHQCCPHVMSTSVPQLPGAWPGDSFASMVTAGDLLAGALSLPFRPPAP
jgi:hypothetical protein